MEVVKKWLPAAIFDFTFNPSAHPAAHIYWKDVWNENNFIYTRLQSKIYSSLIYYKMGHPDFETLFKLIYNIIKFFIPNILKRMLRTKFDKEVIDEIHHQKDVYVLKNNVSQKKCNVSNNMGKIILV